MQKGRETVNDWEEELKQELTRYTDEVTDDVKTAVQETARDTVKLLKATSPVKAKGKKRGQYRKGWRAKLTTDKATEKVLVVHNKTDYQLTHLLEHGHANRDGSFTAARPHIAAAEQAAAEELEGKISAKIKG